MLVDDAEHEVETYSRFKQRQVGLCDERIYGINICLFPSSLVRGHSGCRLSVSVVRRNICPTISVHAASFIWLLSARERTKSHCRGRRGGGFLRGDHRCRGGR